MKISQILLFILLSLIFCKTKDQMMKDYVECVNKQIGKTFVEGSDPKGPSIFSNTGLIWYCRGEAGLSISSTILERC